MNLKTYRAPSMAEALIEVKQDLGRDAVILRTRSYKIGGMLGLGGKSMVEVTASNGRVHPKPPTAPKPSTLPQPKAPSTRSAQALPTKRKPMPEPTGPAPTPIAPSRPPEGLEDTLRQLTPTKPTTAAAPQQSASRGRVATSIESEIASLKRLVGQVLHSTRQTQVSVVRGTLPTGPLPDVLFDLYASLTDNDVSIELADELAAAVRTELSAVELEDRTIVRQTMLRQIASLIQTREPTEPKAGRPRVVTLIGPTGVGKTTTVAKLAANAKLRDDRRVGLLTCDTYRIGAVDQLKTYADIISVPLEVASEPEDVRAAMHRLKDCDLILIDTVGRSQNDTARIDELAAFINAAAPDETHLVLSTTLSERACLGIAERFAPLHPDRVLLTKIDEAFSLGGILGVARTVGLPFSFVTTGQEVPDHIEAARADRLALLVLDGVANAGLPG